MSTNARLPVRCDGRASIGLNNRVESETCDAKQKASNQWGLIGRQKRVFRAVPDSAAADGGRNTSRETSSSFIVAESPPASGKYFYDPEGRITEPLFAALMCQLSASPKSKEEGLRQFQRTG